MYRPAVAYRYPLSLRSTSMTFLTSGMMHTACGIPGLADRREKLLQQLSIEEEVEETQRHKPSRKENTMKGALNTTDTQISD